VHHFTLAVNRFTLVVYHFTLVTNTAGGRISVKRR
jgi:hypothetical protein